MTCNVSSHFKVSRGAQTESIIVLTLAVARKCHDFTGRHKDVYITRRGPVGCLVQMHWLWCDLILHLQGSITIYVFTFEAAETNWWKSKPCTVLFLRICDQKRTITQCSKIPLSLTQGEGMQLLSEKQIQIEIGSNFLDGLKIVFLVGHFINSQSAQV